MSRVYIAAGSNLGNRFQHLDLALQYLCSEPSLEVSQISPVYETAPVGGPRQEKFLNAVWVFETALEPEAVLTILQTAEQSQGRIRGEKNGPREIDLDLAAYDESCFEQDSLCIPHERMHERWFVLKPFCDVAPQWKHPRLKKTAVEILAGLKTSEEGVLYKAVQVERKFV